LSTMMISFHEIQEISKEVSKNGTNAFGVDRGVKHFYYGTGFVENVS